ncbi:MAG TPA: SPASM domain-containing protein [Acidobacteriota bacterium]|nr:SPASM domain-containing protein [Acidobacteriota bacterium]
MKNAIATQIKNFFLPEPPNRSGIYSFRREKNGAITRFHLRVEKNGEGMLLANSSIAARLSASGTLIAKMLLEGKTQNEIETEVRKQFRKVPDQLLSEDIDRVWQFIESLSNPDDTYPIFNLQDPALEPPRDLMAPLHAQIPVVSSEKTKTILQKLWDAGIPHVTFEVLKESSSDETVRCVQYAEDIGMICGVRASGTWFQQPDVMKSLALAGIDYVVVPIVSAAKEKHDRIFGERDFEKAQQCINDCKRWEICGVVEVGISHENRKEVADLFTMLESKGILNVHCFAVAEPVEKGLTGVEIIQTAVDVLSTASQLQMRVIWLPAVSRAGSLSEVLQAGPRTAGDVSVLVDAEGNVYPSRGPRTAAGNVLNTPWKTIWDSDVFRNYRYRVQSNTHCSICPGLEICAADCPGDPQGWDSV